MSEPARKISSVLALLAALLVLPVCAASQGSRPKPSPVLTGRTAFTDWKHDAPLLRYRITEKDLPPPYQTRSAFNPPRMVARAANQMPKVPPGFSVGLFVSGLEQPRQIRTAPNGDIFVADSAAGQIRVLRAADGVSHPAVNQVFAGGLQMPFGIAFYPPGPNPRYLYIGDTDAVLRFRYRNGDLHARGAAKAIVGLPGGGEHWTRDLAFSRDGRRMFIAVGSASNDAIALGPAAEVHRANILVCDPDGGKLSVYARGIRNPVGLAIDPSTGALWASVNERDGLGDNLPPDYITRIRPGGFYGWPWFYIGPHQDPRHPGRHPELKSQVIVPDVLIAPHSASLGIAFYTGRQFPEDYRPGLFAAEHGSWNRGRRTGYKVIFVPIRNGVATGDYMDFLTGFVTSAGKIWGRPVGVTTAHDGALLVTDDGSGSIWRVTYRAKPPAPTSGQK